MTGDSDLIEDSVQLADDGGDLRGQIVRVHHHCIEATTGQVQRCEMSIE